MSLFEKILKPTVKGKKLTSKILDKYEYTVTGSIQTYKTALRQAINGNRVQLYKLYKEALRDNHLAGIIELRKDRVLGTSFNVFNSDGTPYSNKEMFDAKWFYSFINMSLDELYWGFSLIQIDGVLDNNIYDVTQVPFSNVDVEKTLLYPNVYDRNNGINYANKTYAKWLIEVVEDVTNLGVLSDLIPLVLWKKSAMGAWAEYTEIFGMPIRIGKTSSNIETDRQRLATFLKGLSKSAWAVIDEEQTIEFIESSHTDAYNVYEKYIELINKEISKRILGGTDITDSSAGSGYAQSKVHDNQFNSKIKSDLRKMTFVIEDRLFPKMVNLKLIPKGLKFKFDNFENLSLTDRITVDKELNKMKTLDQNYLKNTYRVEFEK